MFNTSTRAVIADLPFPDTIAAVRLDRQKLVVVEARRATVFDLATHTHTHARWQPRRTSAASSP